MLVAIVAVTLTLLAPMPTATARQVETTIPLPDSLGGWVGTWNFCHSGEDDLLYIGAAGVVGVVDAATLKRVAAIPVPTYVSGLCYVPPVRRLFVTCDNIGVQGSPVPILYVIDTDLRRVVDSIYLGTVTGTPYYDSASSKLYCPVSDGDSMAVVDPASLEVLSWLRVPGGYHSYCSNPMEKRVYCTTGGRDEWYTVIDSDGDSILSEMQLDRDPEAVIHVPAVNKVYFCTSRNVWVLDGTADTVLAVIGGGRELVNLIYDPVTNKVFVADNGFETVIVIDPQTDSVTARVRVGEYPRGLALDSGRGKLYCSTSGRALVYILDVTQDVVLDSIPVGRSTTELIAVPDLGRMFALSAGDCQLAALDAGGDSLEGLVTLGFQTQVAEYGAASSKLYLLNRAFYGSVFVVNTTTLEVLRQIRVGAQPLDICVSPAQSRAYVANWRRATKTDSVVTVIDGKADTVLTDLVVGSGPFQLCYNELRDRVYCINRGSDEVVVIDCATDSLVARVQGIPNPYGICWNSAENKVYVAANHSLVAVIDCSTNTVVATVAVPWAESVDWHPHRNQVYVLQGFIAAPMTVLDCEADTVVARHLLGALPMCAEYSPDGRKAYFGLSQNGVLVYDAVANQPVDTIWMGRDVFDLQMSSDSSYLYACVNDSSHVAVIDWRADTVLTHAPTGRHPRALALDPVTGRLFVGNSTGSSVTVIRDSTSPGITQDGPRAAGRRMGTMGCRGVVTLLRGRGASLLDITGRTVTDLTPGENDVKSVPPGVYFILERSSGALSRIVLVQ